ncbi:MAG TPA: hypothetical protein VJZ26_03035 [Blastocatellia bacterium]|nr:hypothetical protein [Blastocatellia bacterium]
MKSIGLLFMTVLLVCATSAISVAQSGQEYEDPSGKFKLVLQGDWKAVSYNDAVGRQKTEFVYRDRSEGLLKISRETLNGSLADLVRQEEENLRIYRVGFERAASETFGGGALSGMRFSFYSTDSGRQNASTFYFLQDKNAVYILRFTGKRGALDTIRNLTDQIARSFQPSAK